jgi:hypothetical protein
LQNTKVNKQFSVYLDGLLVPSQYYRGRFRDEYTQHPQINKYINNKDVRAKIYTHMYVNN